MVNYDAQYVDSSCAALPRALDYIRRRSATVGWRHREAGRSAAAAAAAAAAPSLYLFSRQARTYALRISRVFELFTDAIGSENVIKDVDLDTREREQYHVQKRSCSLVTHNPSCVCRIVCFRLEVEVSCACFRSDNCVLVYTDTRLVVVRCVSCVVFICVPSFIGPRCSCSGYVTWRDVCDVLWRHWLDCRANSAIWRHFFSAPSMIVRTVRLVCSKLLSF